MLEPLKATLMSLEGGPSIDFPYNPKEFTVTRNSGFQARSKGDGPWGGIHWECAKPDELKFDVVLDVSELDLGMAGMATQLLPISSTLALLGMLDGTSVIDEIAELIELTIPGKVEMTLRDKTIEVVRPPFCAFVWADFQFFGGVQSVDSKVVLFNPFGIPKRAEVSITMLGMAVIGDVKAPSEPEELAGYYGKDGYKYSSLDSFPMFMSLATLTDSRIAALAL